MVTYGVTDAINYTNAILTYYDDRMVELIEQQMIFDRFFQRLTVPSGLGATIDIHFDSSGWNADYIPKGAPYKAQARAEYITQITIPEKIGNLAVIHLEDAQDGRFDELKIAAEGVLLGIGRKANDILKTAICRTSSSGTPVDPTALSSPMVTPYWWNSNDNSVVPPSFGANTFSGGHNHVETGSASAITLARAYVAAKHISEHGFKPNLMLLNSNDKYTVLQLASENNSGAIPQSVYEKFNTLGEIAGQFAGLSWVVNDYIDYGVMLCMDEMQKHRRYDKMAPTSDVYEDKKRDLYGRKYTARLAAGVTAKGAGYVLHVT